MPRIRVTALEGLHHNFSGFHAWEPGIYDFPDDPRFSGWLQGHVERGAVEILTGKEREPVVIITPGDEEREPGTFRVGDPVLYATQGGKVQAHTVKRVNDDGTYFLNQVLHHVPSDRLTLAEGV